MSVTSGRQSGLIQAGSISVISVIIASPGT